MTPDLISILIGTAVRSLLFAGVAGLALQLLRVRDVGTRLAAWTAVLYGVLLMPLAGSFAPPLAIPLKQAISRPTVMVLSMSPSIIRPSTPSAPPATQATLPRFDWKTTATGVYLTIASLLFIRLIFGLLQTRRLRRTCRALDDSKLLAEFLQNAHTSGVRKVPALLESDALAVPITLGWTRPSIVLPVSWRAWDDAKMSAVLAHELSHVRRNDYGTLLLASLNRCLFWFNPLSWWLDRHLRELAEQASDDSALRATADHTHYAEILLGFFEALQDGGRVRWQGVAMARHGAHSGSAGRRIDRILAANRKLSVPARWPVMLGLAVLTVPLLYLSAAVRPREDGISTARLLAQATPPTPPTPAAPPSPPRQSSPRDKSRDSYVIVSGDNVTMSGSTSDYNHARGFYYRVGDEYIWFQKDGKGYIIRDPATVKAALRLFEPQQQLGQRQAALGEVQAKLGALQAELGKKQSEVRTTLPDLTREIEKLKEKMHAAGTSEELGDVQALLGELQARVGAQQARIGDQQAKIGEEQAKLGDQQAQLGAQQAALGDEQERQSNEASRQLRLLIDEAVKKGLASPEPR